MYYFIAALFLVLFIVFLVFCYALSIVIESVWHDDPCN